MAEPTGAAFGIYPSSGRRPERLNQSRGVNAPLQLARGWAAGLLGLPGDIEGLVRMLPGIQNETPVLPTSDFYREYLPGYDERPAARAMSGLGALTGGAGATSVVRGGLGAVKRATEVTGKALGPKAAQMAEGYLQSSGLAPGVVKPKGGNWISGAGSPEEAVRGLKRSQAYVGMPPAELEAANASDAALNTWIDKKLAGYIRNEMGTPEDPLRAQIEAFPAKRAELLAAKDVQLAKARADMERAMAARQGFTPEMMTASQARIRDLERERELIEPLTGLHFAPENVFLPSDVAATRVAAGYPRHGVAESQLATDWEVLADAPISVEKAGDLMLLGERSPTIRENPWLAKVPPETPVYSMTPGDTIRNSNLNFSHLIDELRNAVREGSDLPEQLRLPPKQLSKVSMPQAVELVDRINKWRAAQKAEADLARASNVATVEHKAYDVVPGTQLPNERGLRWVELKAPKDKPVVEGEYADPMFDIPPREQARIQDEAVDWALARGFEEDSDELMEAAVGRAHQLSAQYAAKNKPKVSKELEDALKYEGETMGHCVGGYCPDVMEGKSRIFSLRDAKGQPHVTVEVRPGGQKKLAEWDEDELRLAAEEEAWAIKQDGDPREIDEIYEEVHQRLLPEFASYGDEADEIIQIKGKANRAPKDEYLPYVQDFVKSQRWGRVGDIQNTGLIKLGGQYLPKEEVGPLVERASRFIEETPALREHREAQRAYENYNGPVPSAEYTAVQRAAGRQVHPTIPYTYRELRAILDDPEAFNDRNTDALGPNIERIERLRQLVGEQGYARGGAVRAGPAQYDPDRIAALADQLMTMEA